MLSPWRRHSDVMTMSNLRPWIETSDGVQLFYQDWGAGPPIVFVHAWAMSSDVWQYNTVDFARSGYRCISFDRRGHGRSDRPRDGYDFPRLVDDLATVLETLDLRDVTLVGHSLGGAEVAGYLARHGTSRVARVVLLAAATPFLRQTANNPQGLPGEMIGAIQAEWRRDFPRWLHEGADAFYRPDVFGIHRGILDWTLELMRATPLPVAIRCGELVTDTDLRGALKELAVPTLVIHGDADASIPVQFGRMTAALVPGSKYIEYAGAPHGLYLTHRDELHRDVLAHIEERGTK